MLLIVCVLVIYFLVRRVKRHFKYFERHGIPYAAQRYLFESYVRWALKKEHIYHALKRTGQQFPDAKYFGFFELTKPVIVVQDADLALDIGVTRFSSFKNRLEIQNLEPDMLTLISVLRDDDWVRVKSQTSSFFTHSNTRKFLPVFMQHVEYMKDYIDDKLNKSSKLDHNGVYEVITQTLAKHISIGMLISQLFGKEINTFENPNSELTRRIRGYSELGYKRALKTVGWSIAPNIMKFFKIRVLEIEETEYLLKEFTQALNSKSENKNRGDCCQEILNVLIKKAQIKKKQRENQTSGKNDNNEIVFEKHQIDLEIDSDITSQVMTVILGGVDTISSIITTLLYEVTKSEKVQEKLKMEIDGVISEHGKNPDLDTINKMPYIEMVISENLRMWPQTLEVLNRVCTKDSLLEPPYDGGKPYMVQKGEGVWISTAGLHFNEKYWKNPEIFDPERFNEENRPNIYPNSFVPFGIGPRICMAYKFVPPILKVFLFHTIACYDLVKTANFKEKLDYIPGGLSLQPEISYIGIRKRMST